MSSILRLYYTGAEKAFESQVKPSLSLGGYFSSSMIPNDYLGNLFGDITKTTIERDTGEYIGVVLKNETGLNVEDVLITYEYGDEPQGKMEISAITPNIDSCGDPFMESIPNRYSSPLSAAFSEANVAKAKVKMQITQGANDGDVIDVFADSILIATTAPFVGTVGIEAVIDAIVEALSGDATYTAEKSTEEVITTEIVNNHGAPAQRRTISYVYSVIISRNDFGVNTELMELQNSSTDITPPQNMSGGADNTVNIGNIEIDEYIAIWFKRTMTDRAKEIAAGKGDASCESLVADFVSEDQNKIPTEEEICLMIDWTEIPAVP